MSLLFDNISKIQEDFYASNRKKIFMNKSQKEECAEYVTKHISLDQLIKHTTYVIPCTNRIFVDYPLFKQYIIPSHYEAFITHIFSIIRQVMQQYGNYEIHVNLLSFSVSAVERYAGVIQQFYDICCKNNNEYIIHMSNIHIYNTPIMIHIIKSMMSKFNNEALRGKAKFYSKEESSDLLTRLFVRSSFKTSPSSISTTSERSI